MNKISGLFLAALIFAVLCFGTHPVSGEWWTEAREPATAVAPEVFGTTDPLAWRITDNRGRQVAIAPKSVDGYGDGRAVIASETMTLKIDGAMRYGAETEMKVRFRLKPIKGQWASLSFNVSDSGCPGLPVSIRTLGGSDLVNFQILGINGNYYPRGQYNIRLNWSEDFRKIIEHEFSNQPRTEERIMTLRYVLRKDAFEVYLNDILVSSNDIINDITNKARTKPAFTLGGSVIMQLSPNVELFSVRAESLSGAKNLFEPVRIDNRVNESKVDGNSVLRDSLPEPGKEVAINDVPFILPETDLRGNDHIDVGKSWLQNGYLEENAQPQHGTFGGRWSGALNENPSRIQFQVPKGRYKALHLIAVSDEEKDCVPVITAQFFSPGAGRSESFSCKVPFMTAQSSSVKPLSVKLGDGRTANLYLVTIPIDPGALSVYDDLGACSFELTKEVKYFRAYPDPTQYSAHCAGLPSAVHVYAMTLERPSMTLELTPDALGNVWTEPVKPSYTVKIKNLSGKQQTANIEISARSYDGMKTFSQKLPVTVPAQKEVVKTFPLKLERYGYHDLVCTMTSEGNVWTEKKSLAWLRQDTRERGDWEPGRGPIFGFWNWGGGHITPSSDEQLQLMALAGAESDMRVIKDSKVAEALKMKSFWFTVGHWSTNKLLGYIDNPEEGAEWFYKKMCEDSSPATLTNKPELIDFFAEPHLGEVTSGIPPDYYGVEYELSENESARLKKYEKAFIIGANVMKKNWPEVKCLMPWGDPVFPVYFLRKSEEVRRRIDGVAIDIPVFERLAENQMHQVSIHRLYVMREEFKKAGIKNPTFGMFEGPCLPTRPGALTLKEQADNWVRHDILLFAYGIDRLCGGWGVECAGYWGEQHYGGGIMNPLPSVSPKPSYAALATMTRHINRKNFDKWIPTGSLSAYALQFKHYRTGELSHAFWTVRGKRDVILNVPKDTVITVYDQMDNATVAKEKDGKVSFEITSSPCFVAGLKEEPVISLGEPDNSDVAPAPSESSLVKVESKPAPESWTLSSQPVMLPSQRYPVPKVSTLLCNLGDGSWKMLKERDLTYENNHHLQVARFPGEMTTQSAEAPKEKGGRAVAVHLGAQEKERKVMPFYTTLVPEKPVLIPGKPSHIGLWVKASSDWGRVVYFLKDAEGERWISIGTKQDWNCDDIHSWSYFNYDGWRYLRFELPGNSPYDKYRESGSTWWGHFGAVASGGNGLVDLPLSLEKVVVERRTHAMYVIDPQPANPEDVLLADLYAEYENPENKTDDAVRLSKLSMPVPEGMPELGNPIKEFQENGVCSATVITKTTLPEQEADGTQCYVHFDLVDSAVSYDVWVSPYPDGRGALKLGKEWKNSGQLIKGLHQDTDFYVFVVYTDKNNKPSQPSAPYKINLKDIFGMK